MTTPSTLVAAAVAPLHTETGTLVNCGAMDVKWTLSPQNGGSQHTTTLSLPSTGELLPFCAVGPPEQNTDSN